MVPARFAFAFMLMGCAAISQQYVISTVAGGAPIPTPIAATSASIGLPSGVAVGPAEEVYFTGYGDSVYKIDSRGILTRIAGNGRPGLSGDGAPAASAQLNRPTGVAVDAAGNVFIADWLNFRIRKVGTNGIITTVAGNGSSGYSGDGGPATSAQLFDATDVEVDAAGNLYIADLNNYRIRKVAANGIITTVAGNGTRGYSGDGGPATNAQLDGARGLAADATGNVYFADNYRIRKVASNGIITTVAGNGTFGSSGDGGPATNAQLDGSNVAVDALGALYITSTRSLRKVGANGIITTIASTDGTRGFCGDGGAALSNQSPGLEGVAVDTRGNVYLADATNFRICKVASNGLITNAAGNGTRGYSGDGGPASTAQMDHCCPVRSPIDSTVCGTRVNRFGSRTLERPVKWGFSRKV